MHGQKNVKPPKNVSKSVTDVAKSEVFTAVLMKTPVLRDTMSCGLVSTPNHTASYTRKPDFFTTEFF
jgi:hypothetical protein